MFERSFVAEHKEKFVKRVVGGREASLKDGCYDKKNWDACHQLATTLANQFRYNEALNMYITNCDTNNYGKSCTVYADYKMNGLGCEKDVKTAYEYMLKGCEKKDPHGCYKAGKVLLNDEIDGKDRKSCIQKGIELLKEACVKFKKQPACYELYKVFLNGIDDYVDKDYHEAARMLHISCENRDEYACRRLSEMYANGEGVQKDPELAEKYKNIITKRYI